MTMKLCYFAKATSIGPSSRYRIYQYLPYLQSQGVETHVYPLFGPGYFRLLRWRVKWVQAIGKSLYTSLRFVKRAIDVFSIGPADLIVVEGPLFPYCAPLIERALARRYRLILELDDAIYLTRSHGQKIPILLRLSAGAIVGNAALAQYASSYTSRVYIVPTVVDTERFRPQKDKVSSRAMDDDRELRIAWIGLAFNFPCLEMLVPVFLKLQQEYRIIIRVISALPPVLPGVKMEFRRWSFESEVQDLQSCDIGVMPLTDTEWARGKCGLKLLQYMAVGMPAVASPVGVNRDIIREGENGLLAVTEDDWYRQLALLCHDSALRKRIGASARRTVEARYSLKKWGPQLVERYRAIVAEGKQASSGCPISQSVIP